MIEILTHSRPTGYNAVWCILKRSLTDLTLLLLARCGRKAWTRRIWLPVIRGLLKNRLDCYLSSRQESLSLPHKANIGNCFSVFSEIRGKIQLYFSSHSRNECVVVEYCRVCVLCFTCKLSSSSSKSRFDKCRLPRFHKGLSLHWCAVLFG